MRLGWNGDKVGHHAIMIKEGAEFGHQRYWEIRWAELARECCLRLYSEPPFG
jgi:hypothetical protein